MRNTFGSSISVTLFGESHGQMTGAVLDGIAPGTPIDYEYIRRKLFLRSPHSDISTPRREKDEFSIVSGVRNGFAEGTPITILIPNSNTKSDDYAKTQFLARPGHADYTAECKYNGFQDASGGGHFSGRITAALVAAGAVCSHALEEKGIFVGTHIKKLGGVCDSEFSEDRLCEEVKMLSNCEFPVLDDIKGEEMQRRILEAKQNLDSVGGILETAVCGVPAGLGEPWFDTCESVLSHILFSIPAIKGVEFGLGFGFADKMGSEANDCMRNIDGEVTHTSNNNGGILGGITNGMPIIFRTAVKPTPSIARPQNTVDIKTHQNAVIEIKGRHDPCIAHRAAFVVNAAASIALLDLIKTAGLN